MIFSVIILALLAGITYYHYVQGGFTSTISAVCALMAMLVAFGYYEPVLGLFPAGAMADYAAGMLLIALFGLTYIILRLCFDGLIPGNIRLPLWVDRACAAGFGLVAAVMATGVFAVGAQLLPFGPSVGMYSRYEIADRDVIIPRAYLTNTRNDVDAQVRDQLVNATFTENNAKSLMVPVDQFALGLVSKASDGAFSGTYKFAAVHPDLLTEAFANRLGADRGGKRVIINTDQEKTISVPSNEPALWAVSAGAIKAEDFEIKKIRQSDKALTADTSGGRAWLIVRVNFNDRAKDADDYVRLTPSAAPLKLGGETIYPIGAISSAGIISLYRLDDQMLISMKEDNRFVELVYSVPQSAYKPAEATGEFKPNTAILQIKLFGRVDLSGRKILPEWRPGGRTDLLLKSAPPAPAQ